MMSRIRLCIFFLSLLPCILCSRQIDTFYGPIEVDEPVLLELIDSPAFQRLKDIHQYGVAYYLSFREEYNRFDHSIGVFTILRANNASLEEQIAGLLHDVSHTAFSHVGDWVFGKENQEDDYQNSIHTTYLNKTGLADILKKYNFTPEQISPDEGLFPALESSLPDLCADRIDYNIQGAYYQGFITHDEAQSIFNDLRFIDNRWINSDPTLMAKLTRFSLYMTENAWGSPTNFITSRWLSDAILRAIDIGSMSLADFQYGTDQQIWDKLKQENDPIITMYMKMLESPQTHFTFVDNISDADFVVKSKFRGINPWVLSEGAYLRITDIDDTIAKEYDQVKQRINAGWLIRQDTYPAENPNQFTYSR